MPQISISNISFSVGESITQNKIMTLVNNYNLLLNGTTNLDIDRIKKYISLSNTSRQIYLLPICGGLGGHDMWLNGNTFINNYQPHLQSSWTTNPDYSQWNPTSNMPFFYIQYGTGNLSVGNISIFFWYNFYDTLERNVNVNVFVPFNDDDIFIITSSNGTSWSQVWSRGTTTQFTYTMLTFNNIHSLVIIQTNAQVSGLNTSLQTNFIVSYWI